MSDIWARGTLTARIYDHVQLSAQKPSRRRPMKAEAVGQCDDKDKPRISKIDISR